MYSSTVIIITALRLDRNKHIQTLDVATKSLGKEIWGAGGRGRLWGGGMLWGGT